MKTTYYLETYLTQTCGEVKIAETAHDSAADLEAAQTAWVAHFTSKGERGSFRTRTVSHTR